MKKFLKITVMMLGALLLILGIGIGFVVYQLEYKKTEITKSIEGTYTLSMYQVGEPGWPFGPVKGEFVLRNGGKQINIYSFSVNNDGGGLSSGSAIFKWTDDCVKIRVRGEEQEDMLYTLGFDGSSHSEKAGSWFTDEEVISMIKETYGEQASLQHKEANGYVFRAQVTQPEEGAFDFWVEQGEGELLDNYLNSYFKYVTDAYFEKYNRKVEWQESGVGAAKRYIPSFRFYFSYEQELIGFCERICDYIEYCISLECFAGELQFLQGVPMTVSGKYFVFQPSAGIEEYDRTTFYNELYARIDDVLHAPIEESTSSSTNTGKEEKQELSQEILDYYMTLEPGCSYQTDNGMEYRMIPVDRALGSNFYVLVGTKDGGKTCDFVNPDPYNGSGGESRWITFVDEELGFSCLSHAAGGYGSLYRTEDGGNSWEEIKYPSAKAKLPDGTFYNPFVMPEMVYEKDDILYMEVGQGADGDYYDEKGFCHGLYQSVDGGKNWEFCENIQKER